MKKAITHLKLGQANARKLQALDELAAEHQRVVQAYVGGPMATHASVKWDHGLTFTGTAATGFTVPLGGSTAEGGDDDGFRPTELLLISLAGCTAMDVISILQKKRQDVTGFEVVVRGERATDYPRVYTEFTVEYIVRGHHVDPAAAERSIELSVTKYCTVYATLAKAAAMKHTYRIVEEEASGRT